MKDEKWEENQIKKETEKLEALRSVKQDDKSTSLIDAMKNNEDL